jgi:hypothetical protein
MEGRGNRCGLGGCFERRFRAALHLRRRAGARLSGSNHHPRRALSPRWRRRRHGAGGLHYGLLAPAGTPRPVVDRLNAALRALVETEEVKQRIQAEGGAPSTSTPEDYAKDVDSEEAKWGTLVRKLNLKVA